MLDPQLAWLPHWPAVPGIRELTENRKEPNLTKSLPKNLLTICCISKEIAAATRSKKLNMHWLGSTQRFYSYCGRRRPQLAWLIGAPNCQTLGSKSGLNGRCWQSSQPPPICIRSDMAIYVGYVCCHTKFSNQKFGNDLTCPNK